MLSMQELKRLIAVAAGREPADLLIKNCQVLNLATNQIISGNIAICGSHIAGVGDYTRALEEVDAKGYFALPGLIDAHIHIESSYLSPEEFARLVVPRGTTTVMADPHEIVNVVGLEGLDYMQAAAAKTPLRVNYLLPSCVPSTPFETAGANLSAEDLAAPLQEESILGLAELMNYPGVVNADDAVLTKILAAKAAHKLIDGHAPGLRGKALHAYAAAGILADHEVSTIEDLEEHWQAGLYVLLRRGSSCHDLEKLVDHVTWKNYTRALLCSDDLHAADILTEGHLNRHLRLCVEHGLDPVMAVRMASLNSADAFGLADRGALFPGRLADLVLVDDLKQFTAHRVYIGGKLVAQDGEALWPIRRADTSSVSHSMHARPLTAEDLTLKAGDSRVKVIQIQPGSVLTQATTFEVRRNEHQEVLLDDTSDLVRLAVIERHQASGQIGLGLIRGYGLTRGAIASSIAHDSHNIMVAGKDPNAMLVAVNALIEQGGGICLVLDGQVIKRLPLPIAGLMSDQAGTVVSRELAELEALAHQKLEISRAIDPVMTLSFLSLAVIPELRVTDRGLFDVKNFCLTPIEAE